MLLRLATLLFVTSLLTGLALVGVHPDDVGPLSLVAWLHVALSWFAFPVIVVFTLNHTRERWRLSRGSRHINGVTGIVVLVVLLLSGIALDESVDMITARCAGSVHLVSTFVFLAFLAWHLVAPVRGWLERAGAVATPQRGEASHD
jgi:hypothetical membrane protein